MNNENYKTPPKTANPWQDDDESTICKLDVTDIELNDDFKEFASAYVNRERRRIFYEESPTAIKTLHDSIAAKLNKLHGDAKCVCENFWDPDGFHKDNVVLATILKTIMDTKEEVLLELESLKIKVDENQVESLHQHKYTHVAIEEVKSTLATLMKEVVDLKKEITIGNKRQVEVIKKITPEANKKAKRASAASAEATTDPNQLRLTQLIDRYVTKTGDLEDRVI